VKVLKVLGISLNTCSLKPESRGSSDEVCGLGRWCNFHCAAWFRAGQMTLILLSTWDSFGNYLDFSYLFFQAAW